MAKSTKKLLDVELARLRNALDYDEKTGEFIWRIRRNSHAGKVRIGSVAGTPVADRDGGAHINIKFAGKAYRAHRLAWLFMTGEWPKGDVDHKDGVRIHNWWSNLRIVTRGQNNANRHKLTASNVSGKTGVSWVAHRDQWMARINVAGKVVHLGLFGRDKLDDAVKARRAAELRHWGKHATDELVVVKKSARFLKSLPSTRPAPKLDARNKSGKTGVSWTARTGCWTVTIRVDGRHVHIGQFAENALNKAIVARKAAELKYYGAHSVK
jgi:HNH endonuclease